jgi:leucyl/phenylalanyl-tRNA---protein transferase
MPAAHVPDWDSLDLAARPGDCPVAFCADLSPRRVLAAYQHGIIPLPAASEYLRGINEFRYEEQVAAGLISLVGDPADDPYWVAWWSPDPRPVVRAGAVHLGRNARKQLRRRPAWTTTANCAFRRVAEECRAGREPRWLTDQLLETMCQLHRDGWAHSIEVWREGGLIGGALGVGTGRTLSGDSLFGRCPGAARIAVADMSARLAGAGGQLIDAQWDSPFLRSLGAELIPRERYLRQLAGAAERTALPRQPLPAPRLLGEQPS